MSEESRPIVSLSFVWFSHRPDFACLLQSARSVRPLAPEAALTVFVDPADPFTPEQSAALRAAGCRVFVSTRPHGGNLNGVEHLDRQLQALDRSATAADYVVKIDSDTVILSLNWLAEAIARAGGADRWPPAAGFQMKRPVCPLCGPCYALRADVPRALRRHLAAHPRALDALMPKVPEDFATFTLLSACFPEANPALLDAWPLGNSFAGFNYKSPPRSPNPYLFFEVVTFGNRRQLTGDDATRRSRAAEAMRTLLDLAGCPEIPLTRPAS